MKRKRIAIVGAGFSGAALAAELVRQRVNADIVLIDRSGNFGPGLAYGTRDEAHLLNVPAFGMSAYAHEPFDFVQWLQRNKPRTAPGAYVSRATFGKYVRSVLAQARAARFFGGLSYRYGDVLSCELQGARWVLTMAAGKLVIADAVVLALGQQPSRPLSVFQCAGIVQLSPWDTKAQARLPRGDVLLIGTGLTAVDVALSLAPRRKGVIYALSRRGLLPRPHLAPVQLTQAPPFFPPLTLSEAVHAFRQEAAAMAANDEPWQLAMERLRDNATELWRRLSPEEQRRFVRHLRPWWDVHRHRMAPLVAARVEALRRDGRLKILAGEIVSAEPEARGLLVHHRQRHSLVRHRLHVAGVINCTGGDIDIESSAQPLLKQMLRDGLVRPAANGLGFDLDEESRVLDAAGGPHASMFAIGPLTQGAFWESTAVPDIRVWAGRIASHLCQSNTRSG